MRYKVGDKVKVREWDNIDKEFGVDKEIGSIPSRLKTFVSDMKEYCGKIITIKSIGNNYYKIEEDNGDWRWTDDMLINPHFSITDLIQGMACETRNGNRYLFMSGNLIRNYSYRSVDDLTDDLLSESSVDFDIVKVGYLDMRGRILDDLPKMAWKEVIWERNKPVLITQTEALKILKEHFAGKEVEII